MKQSVAIMLGECRCQKTTDTDASCVILRSVIYTCKFAIELVVSDTLYLLVLPLHLNFMAVKHRG